MLDYGTTPGHSNASRWADNPLFDAPTSYSWFIRYRWRALFEPAQRFVWAKGAMTTTNSGWGFEAINRAPFAGDNYNMRHIDGSDNNFAGIKLSVGVVEDEDHTCGATWDGSSLQIYHDGVKLGPPQSFTQSIGVNSVQLSLGNNSSANNGAPVAVGHWVIYINHVLTESEMAQLHVGKVVPRIEKLSWWVRGDVNPPVDVISGVAATNTGTVSLLGVAAVDDAFQGEEFIPMHREIISRELRRNRYANPVYGVVIGPEAAIDELADPINMAHYGYPRAESLVRNRERDQMVRSGESVFCFLTKIGFEPNEYQFHHELEDYEHAIATFWSTLKLPFAVNEEQDGLAHIGVGGEQKTFTRNDEAYVQQADGKVATVGPNAEKMNHLGFRSEDIRTTILLNTAFALGLTTNWTDNSGDGTGEEETDDIGFKNIETYPRSLKLTKGTGDTYWTQARASSTVDGPGNVGKAHFLYKDVTGRTSWRLHRNPGGGGGNYWDDTNLVYTGTALWNLLPDSGGQWAHAVSNDFGALSSSTTYTLDVGIASGSTGDVVIISDAELQRHTNTVNGTLLPSTDSVNQSERDELFFIRTGDATKQLVYAKRYTIRFKYRIDDNPNQFSFFPAYDLFWNRWNLSNNNNYIDITYSNPGDPSIGVGIHHHIVQGGLDRGYASYLIELQVGQTYEIACRLTDDSGYELGLPARTFSVFVDGVKGIDAQLPGGLPTSETDTKFWLGSGDQVLTNNVNANGILSDLNIQQRAIPDEEILALR